MKAVNLINNNDLTESELWQLLIDALMIHFKNHNSRILDVTDTSFTNELTTKYDDFTYYQVEYTINPSNDLNILWNQAEKIEII
jgi:hypothetical protein